MHYVSCMRTYIAHMQKVRIVIVCVYDVIVIAAAERGRLEELSCILVVQAGSHRRIAGSVRSCVNFMTTSDHGECKSQYFLQTVGSRFQ